MRYFFVIFLLFFPEVGFSQNSNINNDYIDLTNKKNNSNDTNKNAIFNGKKIEKINKDVLDKPNKDDLDIPKKKM